MWALCAPPSDASPQVHLCHCREFAALFFDSPIPSVSGFLTYFWGEIAFARLITILIIPKFVSNNYGMKESIRTIRQLVCWSYANLAMAHSAVKDGVTEYGRVNFMIRAKLYKGLLDGTMQMGSMLDEEKVKLNTGLVCVYCGKSEDLTIDHLLPKIRGGANSADNSVFACRNCNSSKCDRDLMEWYTNRGKFPPLLILRRYLKLIYSYCKNNDLLDLEIDGFDCKAHPFKLEFIPTDFPAPSELRL